MSLNQNANVVRHWKNKQPEKVSLKDDRTGFYHEEYFRELLILEKRRCERSEAAILLMLTDLEDFEVPSEKHKVLKLLMQAFAQATREIDIKGWYAKDSVVGVIFTGIVQNGKSPEAIQKHIVRKCSDTISALIGVEQLSRIRITWEAFPNDFLRPNNGPSGRERSDTSGTKDQRLLALAAKRLLDIMGSAIALILFSPLFLLIAAVIKLDSKGPVLFRQERIGCGGKKFVFLKFRSMHINNDPTIHKEYIRSLIHEGKTAPGSNGTNGKGTFKIKSDPRVTRVGKILRKSSLDELPQLINVLTGDMSLVGPRPPIAYECQEYNIWHRKRIMEMRPGITGLWQVLGRSATTFDDMVRMDIKYIREWSFWLDCKIILKTPLAVLLCKGAY